VIAFGFWAGDDKVPDAAYYSYTSPEPDELRGQPLPAGAATDSDRQRLEELRVSLDQCWVLLRQRRARRDAGRDPDGAELRSGDVVGRYEQ